VKLAQDAGFDNFNLDLMYALPEQTLAMAETRPRARARTAAGAHLALPADAGAEHAVRGEAAGRHPRRRCQLGHAGALPGAAGRSGFAQVRGQRLRTPGRQCAHNLNYWHFGDYLGIGAGAHGKLTLGSEQAILRRWKVKHPAAYLASAARRPRSGAMNASNRRVGRSTTCSMRCGWWMASPRRIRGAHRAGDKRDRHRTPHRPGA
jgi:oxygen-independent coproporphyrinogen-3 oxidase